MLQVELSFVTGDIIYVYGDMDDDGFYMGELNGVRGLVPSNFLTEAPPDYEGGARGGRRPMPPHLGPPDHRRPPGPGARGPPPPPREGAAGGHGPPHPRDERGARKGRALINHLVSSFLFSQILGTRPVKKNAR